jgi:hypothetical protein
MIRNIEAIVPANNPLHIKLIELASVADAEAWLADLVAQAYYEKPDNPELAPVAAEFGITGFVPEPILVRLVQAPGFPSVSTRISTSEQVAAAVCRGELGGNVFGTGFLIGADLLLTAEHVLSNVLTGSVYPNEVAFQFDYHITQDGAVATSGTVFRLSDDWLVVHESHVSLCDARCRLARRPTDRRRPRRLASASPVAYASCGLR